MFDGIPLHYTTSDYQKGQVVPFLDSYGKMQEGTFLYFVNPQTPKAVVRIEHGTLELPTECLL